MTYADYETVSEQPTLRFERRIAHPVQAVWEAVTEPSELVHWFPCEVEVDLRVGGRMTFHFTEMALPDAASTLLGEVTELDPPTRFSFLWGEDHLHFALEPVDGGSACMLRFSVELDSRDKAARDGAGWHVCLDTLERHLDGAEIERPDASDDWRGHYEEYQRRGFPAGAVVPSDP
jgi:uncharacterized protein YndB with AHSA1/START domain